MKSILVLVAGLATVIPPRTQNAGMADGVISEMTGQFVMREISTEIGKRRYKLFIPSGYERSTAVPLVVMLHGCTQDPDDIARGTRLNEVAEEKLILVVYPEQPESSNPKKCWNWYDPNHQKRDIGEPALIAAITRQIMQDYRVDLNRVYVAGVSAGAAMAVTVALAYPDLFVAVGSHSGIPYGAATNVMEALSVMQGKGPELALLVSRAKDAMRERARAIPAIIFQGGSDHTVNAENSPRLVAQLAAVQGMRANEPTITSSGVAAGYHYTRTTRGSGDATVEAWIVDELGHAWSGGSSDGTFTDTHGPDATKEIVRYFLEHPRAREGSGK